MRAGFHGPLVMSVDHAANPLDLAGKVAVVGSRLDAGGHERRSIKCIWPHCRENNVRRAGQVFEGRIVRAVRDDGVERRGLVAETRLERVELVRTAPGNGPAKFAIAAITFQQIVGDELARETSRAEDDDVVLSVCLHCHSLH